MLGDEAIFDMLALKDDKGRPALDRETEAAFARILWMRGYVFRDEALMRRAAPLLGERYPQLRAYLRQAEGTASPIERRRIYTHMILKHPGLSPFVYDAANRRKDDLTIVMSRSPVEGNWWCSGQDRTTVRNNEEALKQAFFLKYFPDAAPFDRYAAYRTYGFGRLPSAQEELILNETWRRFRDEYAPFKMISAEAQEKLAALPRGSAFLGEEVHRWADSPAGYADWLLQRDDRLPEALHLVVFATRTSCHTLETGNSDVSKAAFHMLHRRYPGSIWAARTPYWFDKIERYRR